MYDPQASRVRPHLALYVSQVNGLGSNVQEHLLAPQFLVLSQEGESCLGFLHILNVPVLEGECQQVLQAGRQRKDGEVRQNISLLMKRVKM